MEPSRQSNQRNIPRRRPTVVTIVGYIEILLGFVGLIYSVILFFSLWIGGTFAGGLSGGVAGFFTGVIVGGFELLVALITLAVGRGLLRGRGWAWEFAIFISIINLIVGFIQLTGAAVPTLRLGIVGAGGFTGVGTIVICLLALYYLYRPNVRAFFRR